MEPVDANLAVPKKRGSNKVMFVVAGLLVVVIVGMVYFNLLWSSTVSGGGTEHMEGFITGQNMTLCPGSTTSDVGNSWSASTKRLAPGFSKKFESEICTGVPGRPDQNYIDHISFYDNWSKNSEFPKNPELNPTTIPNITGAGCIVASKDNINVNRSTNLQNLRMTVDGTENWRNDIVALHKIWGYVPGKWEQGGVHKDNVYAHTLKEGPHMGEQVIRLRITGDNCDRNGQAKDGGPTIPFALNHKKAFKNQKVKCGGKGGPCNDQTKKCWTEVQCKQFPPFDGTEETPYAAPQQKDANHRARCGACIATRNVYGPGKFELTAAIRKTDWKGATPAQEGRGYVFAMWTFSYAEIYSMGGDGTVKPMSSEATWGTECYDDCSCVGDVGDGSCASFDNKPMSSSLKGCTPGARNTSSTGLQKVPIAGVPESPFRNVCSGDVFYTAVNHEIDIEIPANSPQYKDSWETNLTWATMNANTWVGDTDLYQGDMPWYSQAMVKIKDDEQQPQHFISENGEFHKYTIDWYVDKDPTKSYVKFYFDDELVYATTRFVPTHSGRLVIGPWPGWWGTGGSAMDFSEGYVDIKSLNITPYVPSVHQNVKIRSFPQTFDQMIPANVDQTECCPGSHPTAPEAAANATGCIPDGVTTNNKWQCMNSVNTPALDTVFSNEKTCQNACTGGENTCVATYGITTKNAKKTCDACCTKKGKGNGKYGGTFNTTKGECECAAGYKPLTKPCNNPTPCSINCDYHEIGGGSKLYDMYYGCADDGMCKATCRTSGTETCEGKTNKNDPYCARKCPNMPKPGSFVPPGEVAKQSGSTWLNIVFGVAICAGVGVLGYLHMKKKKGSNGAGIEKLPVVV